MLRKVGVAGPADIDARWRGDTHVFNALMAAFDAPVNSDYQPYVDLNAARMRFVQANFQPHVRGECRAACRCSRCSAPSVPRTAGSESALGSALAAALAASPETPVRFRPRMRTMAMRCGLRASFCVPASPADRSRSCSKALSARRWSINELPSARAAAVWTEVQQGACYRSLDPNAPALGRPVRSRRRPRCSGHVRARHARRRVGAERVRAQLRVERCRRRGHRAQAAGGRADACSSCMRRRRKARGRSSCGKRPPARRSRRSANRRRQSAVAMSTSIGRSTRIRSAGVIPTR